MNEICQQLEREDYNARICKCHPDPEFPQGATSDQKNLLRSEKCLKDADAAVFIFFETVQGRFPNWDGEPAELNGSVIREMSIWMDRLKRPPSRSLVVFEGDLREEYGSLIPGSVDDYGCEEDQFSRNDFEELYDCISAVSWKWVAGVKK